MKYIQRYFGVLLLLACLSGMIIPEIGSSSGSIIMISLSFIIFCSFFQINFSRSVIISDFSISVKFWILRFILLPVIIFLIFKWINIFTAQCLLLSFILPAAVSSPAFSVLYGGKPELSLKVLVLSSFFSVLSIPLLLNLLTGPSVNINTGRMLLTLFYTIILPFILHLPLRNVSVINKVITHYNSLFTLLGLSIIYSVATSHNKLAIMENPVKVMFFFLGAIPLFLIMYLIGYFIFPSVDKQSKRTFSISSGANNIGLGVTLTALFFQGDMNIFFIVSQLVWVIMLIPLRRIFR